ncbi:PrsW family glutamic-type intramembrane protease [Dongia sp.]|uniref:PrsW family glutamic-type intramembrane protease n=1 Tax=Dongia sp. TaxID=1977262 RepID=UPI00375033E9
MLVLATFLTATFPPLLLTAFFLTHYRHRLGFRLGIKSFGLGLVAAALAILMGSALEAAAILPRYAIDDGLQGALWQALIDAGGRAAIPEEIAKFLMVWLVIRLSKDCDSGGDLFCGAILVGLGFAALENVLYVARASGNWAVIGTIRGMMAIPGHTIDGMFMGYFLALWWRKALPAVIAVLLALILPIAAHTLYDFPLMALDNVALLVVRTGLAPEPLEYLRFMQFGVMLVSALGAIWVARQELIEVWRTPTPDGDLHPADPIAVGWWRRAGWALAGFGAAVAALGIALWITDTQLLPAARGVLDDQSLQSFGRWLVWLFNRQTGQFLFGLALFPLAFAAILQMRAPKRIGNPFAIWPSRRPWA